MQFQQNWKHSLGRRMIAPVLAIGMVGTLAAYSLARMRWADWISRESLAVASVGPQIRLGARRAGVGL